MSIFQLTILLFLNTIIEFLPISSTAHGLIIYKILNINIDINLILAVAQIGIIIGICNYFKNNIIDIIKNLIKFDKKYILFCLKVLLTMLPTIFIGTCFYSFIKNYCQNNLSISICLIIGSGIMFLAEKHYKNNKINNTINSINNLYDIDFKSAIKIGLFQCLSLIPGVSRSASTVSGAMFSNLSRNIAIELSFFISIPISLSASFYDIYKYFTISNNDFNNNYTIIIYCFIISLCFSLFFCKKIINFLKNNNLYIFIYYRVVLGLLILIGKIWHLLKI